ncbi:Hypothetical predicted protein [Pelobates cultripes]|uniref:Uncharacterized protein n=1 Tax=Pelobates cultripes TaxID=61616 RepID=A0AAD1TL96_PELCU|nr:Hypothetical predicted protein [Pelobates cultripes]
MHPTSSGYCHQVPSETEKAKATSATHQKRSREHSRIPMNLAAIHHQKTQEGVESRRRDMGEATAEPEPVADFIGSEEGSTYHVGL